MTPSHWQKLRSQGIDGRARLRRLLRWREQRARDTESESRRAAVLAMLGELSGKLEAGAFTPSELDDARAALTQPRDPRQTPLDFDNGNGCGPRTR